MQWLNYKFKVFLIGLLISNTCYSKETELDILLLILSQDIQSYILYFDFLKKSDNDLLKDSLYSDLEMKLYNLEFYIKKTDSIKTLNLVCESQRKLKKKYMLLTSSCENKEYMQICNSAYNISKFCQEKISD